MKLLMELGLKSVVAPPRHHDVNARGHEQVNNNNTLYSAVCLYYLKKKFQLQIVGEQLKEPLQQQLR